MFFALESGGKVTSKGKGCEFINWVSEVRVLVLFRYQYD